jgi:beta-aspartyl-peptidase (threonine type)
MLSAEAMPQFALAIHGGAGTIRRAGLTTALEAAYHAGLRDALTAGQRVLADGGSALDAVTEAVVALEDSPLFNAGRGAVFTSAGRIEMDAAVMDGRDRSAGAVAGVLGPRNPVRAARAVMEHPDAVLMAGQGALDFCRAAGVAFEPESYFHSERAWKALQKELERRSAGHPDDRDDADRHGTVGAVALDRAGNLAAATSTGGMTAKPPGRIGDTPVIGAGTWAENGVCAVSATGTGEIFIRHGAGHEIAARMRLGGQSLAAAAAAVVSEIEESGGHGGLIAIDAAGNVALPLNSQGMYRGVAAGNDAPRTAIYAEEQLAEMQ